MYLCFSSRAGIRSHVRQVLECMICTESLNPTNIRLEKNWLSNRNKTPIHSMCFDIIKNNFLIYIGDNVLVLYLQIIMPYNLEMHK